MVALTIIYVGCTKEKAIKQPVTGENEETANEIKVVEFYDENSKTTITMLEFVDVDHYESTVSDLERQLEEHDDAFLAEHDQMDLEGEELDSIEVVIGFVAHQPLIDFENYYNIPATMRQDYVVAEEAWLNNEVLDMVKDPDLTYCFSEAEMTLLNPEGEVKIEDKIYKFTEKGYVQISDLDIETLIRIENGDIDAYSEPTVTTNIEFNGGGKGSCSGWKTKSDFDPYSNKRRVKRVVFFHGYPFKATGGSKLKSYKKKNGKWRKHRMNLGVATQCHLKNNDCWDDISMWSGWKRKKRKSISKRATYWGLHRKKQKMGAQFLDNRNMQVTQLTKF